MGKQLTTYQYALLKEMVRNSYYIVTTEGADYKCYLVTQHGEYLRGLRNTTVTSLHAQGHITAINLPYPTTSRLYGYTVSELAKRRKL